MTAGSIPVPAIIPLKAPQGLKHVIDSSTRIELVSGKAGSTLIFYTLNGTRPNYELKFAVSHTYEYRQPFTLSPGKVTIKAMACSLDKSKESSVVTRIFTVLQATHHTGENSEDEMGASLEYESPSQPPSISTQLRQRLSANSRSSMTSEGVVNSDLPPSEISPTSLQRSRKAPFTGSSRSLGQASGHSVGKTSIKSTGKSSVRSVGKTSVKSMGQNTALLAGANTGSRPATAEIPKPVCLYCNAPCPKDPSHHFCTHCGSQLPSLPNSDPKPPLQVAVCSNCRAHLPLESTTCLVCEHTVLHPSPIPLIHAQAKNEHMLREKIVCLICGTRNPPENLHCLTCEKPLPPEPAASSCPASIPPPLPTPVDMRPISGSSYMMCGVCGRVNVSDARFCDWCGGKPEGSQLSVQCGSCLTANEWHHRHCYACGSIIKAPLRPEVELSSTMKMPANMELDKNVWVPIVEIADKGPEMKTKGAQTDGIFYPSARTIGNMKGSEFMKKMIHASARDRLPKLHNYSPGKGLWRMQVEHICTHLRAHTQSCNSFQSSIGRPHLGKLLFADVKGEDDKVDINLTFAAKQNCQDSSLPRSTSCGNISVPSTQTQFSPPLPTKVPPAAPSPTALSKPRQQQHRKRTDSTSQNTRRRASGLSGETKKLYKVLSQNSQGRKEVVNQLIQKGADVNACSPDTGLPMLSLAASNGHFDCIPTLVENGAKVNGQAKRTGNTALHEAVLKGPSHVTCIETLLGQGADPKLRNGNGLTPCDLAMKLQYDIIVTCFATYVGAGLLDNLYKHQPSLTL